MVSVLQVGPRLLVLRKTGPSVRASGLVLPDGEARGASFEGTVIAIGSPDTRSGQAVPLECATGDVIVYSSRVDAYVFKGQEYDLVEDASVIAKRP